MRQAATVAHLRCKKETKEEEEKAHVLWGLRFLVLPAPPRHQRTDLSGWISSPRTAKPFYCHSGP